MKSQLQTDVVTAAVARSHNLMEQLMLDMPALLNRLYDLHLPLDVTDEYGDIMQLVAEIMSTHALLIRYAFYGNSLDK